ncbi:chromosome transmission fidelity 4 isoform X2 [Rhodnius prolixus]|uniref:chromosome transmission fidelity 4 isoform X2 n=1 Tax=Rhodnius prolixus TaxID=13249 RepID=UPI003D189196
MDKIGSYRYAHAEGHTDICYSENSKYIVTCGCEGDVRIWEGVNDADQKDTCVGERAWSIAQKGNSLYVGTDTNIVQAYTFPDMELDGIITRFTAPVTQIDISPDGRTLVAGSCDMEIRLVDLTTMDCKVFAGHKAPVLSVCVDPKLEYIVSSSCDATVKVWCVETKKVLKEWSAEIPKCNAFESSKSLCRIHFSRDGNLLAIPLGETVRIYERKSWDEMKSLSPSTKVSVVKFSPNSRLLAAGTDAGDIVVWDLTTERELVPYNKSTNIGQENHSVSGIAWKKDCSSLVFCNVAGQLAELVVPLAEEAEFNEQQHSMDDVIADEGDIPLGVPQFDDDDDEDDENVISLGKLKSEAGFGEDGEYLGEKKERTDDNLGTDEESQSSFPSHSNQVPEIKQQPAFQPSSTPLHLQQRFMVWNSTGIVRHFNTEDMNDIDIEFHDTSLHHNFRMNNIAGHTMGALTPQALILACPTNETFPSKLTCVLLGGRDSQREWDISMMDGEEPIGVTGGNGWIAVATNLSHIRIMTIDGTQTDVTSIHGKFVAMNGSGSLLAVVFHSPAGGLWYTEYRCQEMLLTAQVAVAPLPLSPGDCVLRWIGYTDEGSLATYDSAGVLRIQYGDVWRPVSHLDNECKSKFDHYFVVGISELYQTVRCILCKGTYYPHVIPKPLISEVKWKFPLCEMDAEKNRLEEEYVRSRLTVPHLSTENNEDSRKALEKVVSITAMKLFALACRSNLDRRAISLCEIMPSLDVINLASKYAVKIGQHNLATKVTDIAQKFVAKVESNLLSKNHDVMLVSKEMSSKKYVPNENHSQDMFEDSPKGTPSERKRKEKESSPKPIKIVRGGNPFKKNTEVSSLQNGVTSNSEDSNSNKGNFMTWFAENKEKLEEEFPLLKESELVIAAMKKYKLTSSNNSLISNDTQESEPSPAGESNESKKRKARRSDDENNSKKKPNSLSKLKSFSFKPRT